MSPSPAASGAGVPTFRLFETGDDLVASRQERLREALAGAPFDVFIAGSPANVFYASGYRSMPAEIYPGHRMAALVTIDRTVLVAPCGDAAAAFSAGISPDDFAGFGRCYFESPDGCDPATRLVDATHETFADALVAGFRQLGNGRAAVGLDEASLGTGLSAQLRTLLPEARLVDASDWMLGVRAVKLPAEVARLARAAALADAAIQQALAVASEGWSEQDIAREIAATMVAGGGLPRFLSVQVGDRGALSDAHPTSKRWQPGDLLRMDVGCTVEGYWSDMARTAVLGEPTPLQQARHAALLAGEQAELEAIRPGVIAGALFDLAVGTTRAAGLPGYRRRHCGHGIGLEIYEPPLVGPGVDRAIQEGMVLCLETPFYEIGWGGILTEDTVLVTADGHQRFTTSRRDLRVVPR